MKGRETKTADPTALAALWILLHKLKVCSFSFCGAGSVGKETNTQSWWSYKQGMAIQQCSPPKQNVLAWPIFTRKKRCWILWISRRRVSPRPGLRSTSRPLALHGCRGWRSVPWGRFSSSFHDTSHLCGTAALSSLLVPCRIVEFTHSNSLYLTFSTNFPAPGVVWEA